MGGRGILGSCSRIFRIVLGCIVMLLTRIVMVGIDYDHTRTTSTDPPPNSTTPSQIPTPLQLS